MLKEKIIAPMKGEIIELTAVADEVFASGVMGSGFAIKPTGTEVFAPVSGKIVTFFPTKHAIGIQTESGLEVLIHVGMDTVMLNGKGFTSHKAEGDTVKAGDKLLDVDFDLIRDEVPSLDTPIVFTNFQGKVNVLKSNVDAKEENIVSLVE